MFVSQAETNVFRKRLFCGQKLTFPETFITGYIHIYIYLYLYICIHKYVYMYICVYMKVYRYLSV